MTKLSLSRMNVVQPLSLKVYIRFKRQRAFSERSPHYFGWLKESAEKYKMDTIT